MGTAKKTEDRRAAQLTPVASADALKNWWAPKFVDPFYCMKVEVVDRFAGENGEDFITFSLADDGYLADPPDNSPFTVDLNAGGVFAWPYIPSTAQMIVKPGREPSLGYLFLNQDWANSEGLGELGLHVEDGGNGGKWPISTGLLEKGRA